MTLHDTKHIMASTPVQRPTNASGHHSHPASTKPGGIWLKRCPARSRASRNIIIMFMLLAPVVHAEYVWCEGLTRIFVASQPSHCGHVFRQGEGHPLVPSRQGWTYGGCRLGWGHPHVMDSSGSCSVRSNMNKNAT